MSDEKKLNSLERFRKQSARLVLEEHSHCEVPAGCGGVVLRWRNPAARVPVLIHLYTAGKESLFIDGVSIRATWLDLAPARHVLSVVIENVELSGGLLMMALVHEPEQRSGRSGRAIEQPLKVVSATDGSWRSTLDVPANEEWMSLSFDDRSWPALVSMPVPQLEEYSRGWYACRRCQEQGAECLGLPGRRARGTIGTVRIRKVFDVLPLGQPQ